MGARDDFRASNFKIEPTGTSYQLDIKGKSFLVRLPLIGRFNIYNSLAALAAIQALGLDVRAAVLALARAPQVPGRLEAVPARRQFQVFVDYAHTDDALLTVIKTCRDLSPNRLIVVFGCGGNRDKSKRPLMGAVADQNADYSIITSDNPRKEDPAQIIRDIEAGFRTKRFESVLDRREAITRAIQLAQPRDIVLIAGKGHEKYQEFADRTIPFNDSEFAARAYRTELSLQVVGITGSNGKTSTKEMVAAVLGEKYVVTKTVGNLNNHIGVPLSILMADSNHQVAIWEFGMNHTGELAPLVEMAKPGYGIITNIGVAHIEFLGSREAIAREKAVLAEHLPSTGVVILNADDEYSDWISAHCSARTIKTGVEQGAIQARQIAHHVDGEEFILSDESGEVPAFLPVPGEHMVKNAMQAVAIGRTLGLALS